MYLVKSFALVLRGAGTLVCRLSGMAVVGGVVNTSLDAGAGAGAGGRTWVEEAVSPTTSYSPPPTTSRNAPSWPAKNRWLSSF